VNQLPQSAFIGAVRVNGVKSREAQTAKGASPAFIQGKPVQKRRPAGDAKELGNERLGRFQTLTAHGNPADFLKGFSTDTAFVWENKLKQAAKRLFRSAKHAIGQSGQEATT